MDAIETLKPMLRVEVFGPLTVVPFGLQFVKGMLPVAHRVAACSSAALVFAVGIVLLSVNFAACDWRCVCLQSFIAWVYVELVYTKIVEPLAKSSNPIVPNS